MTWKVVYTPYSGCGDDGGTDRYELVVTLADGCEKRREDDRVGTLASVFSKDASDKRDPATWSA